MPVPLADWLASITNDGGDKLMFWANWKHEFSFKHTTRQMTYIRRMEDINFLIREASYSFVANKLGVLESIFAQYPNDPTRDQDPRVTAKTNGDLVVKVNFGPSREHSMLFYHCGGKWYPCVAYDDQKALVGKTCYDEIYLHNPFFMAIGRWLETMPYLTLFSNVRDLYLCHPSKPPTVLESNIGINLPNVVPLRSFNLECCYAKDQVNQMILNMSTNDII